MSSTRPGSLREWVSRLSDPALLRKWAETYRHRRGFRAFWVRQGEILVFTARSVYQGEISRRAAALTYHTLLAIVPVLAVGFALFKAFGGLAKLQEPLRRLIVDNLAVGRAEEVGRWLDQFINNISAGAIAGVGVLLLFYSAIGLLTNSEKAFNRIWGVEQGRPLHLRFAIYWCLITLGPPLVGLSVSVSARLQQSIFAEAVLIWLPWGMGKWLLSLGSALSICTLFVLSYIIVPNTRVRFRSALIGGIVAGLLWSASKAAFFWLQAGSVKYSAIYGALGALPLLMIWLYVSWTIVLFGAFYTYAHQSASSGKLQEALQTTSQKFREELGARLMVEICRAFYAGDPPPTASVLSELAGASVGTVRHVLGILGRHHLVVSTRNGGDDAFLPGQDIAQLTLQDVVDTLRRKNGADMALNQDDALAVVQQALGRAEQASSSVLDKVDLRSIVHRNGPEQRADISR